MMLPALEKAAYRALRAQTEIHLLAADLAIRRYRLRHGRLPERLQDLVPDFLATVPLDGMDGQPLRYRRDETNAAAYVLWSVGEDLTDNGGDGSWPKDKAKSANKSWWNARDAVLPQPATPAQIADWKSSQTSTKTDATPRTFRMGPELMKRYGLLPEEPTNSPPAN